MALVTRRAQSALLASRGFFGVGVEHPKTEANVGTLWRSAFIFGASFLFTVGRRYKKQTSDTLNTWKQVPLFHYDSLQAMSDGLPTDCPLVGVELHETSEPLRRFDHPVRAAYLLGAEDNGLSREAVEKCHKLVQLPGRFCLNVAVAGSIVMHDRYSRATDKAYLP